MYSQKGRRRKELGLDAFNLFKMNILITEEYEKQCGEVFLTVNGNLVIHCTLCELKFYGFKEYAQHVHVNHFVADSEVDCLQNLENNTQDLSPRSCGDTETFATLVSEEDLKMLDELDFNAPEPQDCKEIEEYVISLKNGEPNVELKTTKQICSKQKAKKIVTSSKISTKKSRSTVMYKCPHCDFVTHANSSINQHVRRHTEARKVKCTLCPKRFFMPSELKVHMRFHTEERPYLCTDCGNAFHTCSALSTHLTSCRDIRDKECVRCGKKFHNLTALRNHMTSHSNERPFHCKMCLASFKLAKALKSHLKIHENKQEYKCQLCPASFNQAPGLFAHLKSHTRANSISISVRKSL